MHRLTQFFVFTLLLALLSGCSASSAPSPTDFQPTLTPSGPETTTTIQPLTLSGPETTPIVPRPYPAVLTLETAAQGISAVVDAPSSITGLADVQAIITKHTQLARDKGLSFDHMAIKYVAAEQRWFLVPVTSDGMITGWLEIADATSQSGWRFAEQPTWDSQYHPSTDTYQYGLPALHDPANHFETGFANGFPILIEVTASGTPQYWNNIVQKTTLLVEGAPLPTETPTPEATQIPFESGPSLEFSPLLPAVWSKEWTGKVANMDIPIFIGLSEGVYNDKTPPITSIRGVWMTQEGLDIVADAFLRTAHYRYTEIMGNTATYEEYVDIRKNQPTGGEVNLLITDNELNSDGKPVRREALIDPRQGFSLLYTDKVAPKIGVKHDRNNTSFFGVDGQGRLLLASDYFSRYPFNKETFEFGVSTTNSQFIAGSFYVMDVFGYAENRCMVNGDIDSICGEQRHLKEVADWNQLYINKYTEMLSTGNFKPFWGLDRP